VAVADYLAVINGLLALFNLLPAFPLDGGRMLRAALWGWKGDIVWATRIAATSGGLFGLMMIAFGLVSAIGGNVIGGIWLFVLGLFLRAAAGGAVARIVTRDVFAGRPVRRFMREDPIAVDPDLPLERLVDDYVYRYYFKTFPVTRGGQLLGCVRLATVAGIDRERWPWQTVGQVMEPCTDDTVIGPDADASAALEQMQRTGQSRLLVTENGLLVGVLSIRDLMNFLSVRIDLGAEGQHPRLN
jgi:CBS domain-containing protein